MRRDSDMDLRPRLLNEKKKLRFISIAALTRLITESSVAAHLAFRGIQHQRSGVSAIVSTAPKLFAILIILKLEHHILDFVRGGKTDDMFPISEADIPAFETEKHRQEFFLEQWTIPPRFDRKRHLEFPRNAKPPFLEKERSNNGTFGIIYKVKVADGHLPGYSAVS